MTTLAGETRPTFLKNLTFFPLDRFVFLPPNDPPLQPLLSPLSISVDEDSKRSYGRTPKREKNGTI